MHALAARDAAGIGLFPGIDAMLAELFAMGVPLAVLSSNREDTVRRVLGSDNARRIARYACGAALFGKARRLAGLDHPHRAQGRLGRRAGRARRDPDQRRGA